MGVLSGGENFISMPEKRFKRAITWMRRFPQKVGSHMKGKGHWQALHECFHPNIVMICAVWLLVAPIMASRALGTEPGALPLRWQLIMWASIFYCGAVICFVLRCPDFIRRYPDHRHYCERGHSARWLVWEVFNAWRSVPRSSQEKLFERLTRKGYASPEKTQLKPFAPPQVAEIGTEWGFTFQHKDWLLRISENLPEERQKDLFWEIFARHAEGRAFARMAIWVLLLISGCCVIWALGHDVLNLIHGRIGQ